MSGDRRRRQLLLMSSVTASGVWHNVKRVEMIEFIGGTNADMIIVEVVDESRNSTPPPYTLSGAKREHYVNIPRGRIRVLRARGDNPITVYAVSGK
jgi:hypothetical protein